MYDFFDGLILFVKSLIVVIGLGSVIGAIYFLSIFWGIAALVVCIFIVVREYLRG